MGDYQFTDGSGLWVTSCGRHYESYRGITQHLETGRTNYFAAFFPGNCKVQACRWENRCKINIAVYVGCSPNKQSKNCLVPIAWVLVDLKGD